MKLGQWKVRGEKDAKAGEKQASLEWMKWGYFVNWQAEFHTSLFEIYVTRQPDKGEQKFLAGTRWDKHADYTTSNFCKYARWLMNCRPIFIFFC